MWDHDFTYEVHTKYFVLLIVPLRCDRGVLSLPLGPPSAAMIRRQSLLVVILIVCIDCARLKSCINRAGTEKFLQGPTLQYFAMP